MSPAPPPHAEDDLPLTSDLLVVGAGTMGAWTAYWAQVGPDGAAGSAGPGRSVTLLDAWGVGHARSTSGDETRITRAAHGGDRLYPGWSRRSLRHWRRLEEESGARLFVPCGVLWFGRRDDGFEAGTVETLTALGIPVERLDPEDLRARWPQLGVDDLRLAAYEPEGGALMARQGCQTVVAAFRRAGGRYGLAGVKPARVKGARLVDVVDAGGRRFSAETFVFAAGPWLPRLFPELLGQLIRVTKQDVLFFGPPAGDGRFQAEALPAWADYDAAYWGLPGIDQRGPKVGPDRLGPVFDPSAGERLVDPESVRLARRYLRRRFPALAEAPVVETRVCQYESTPDGHFVIDRHPDLENVWLAGGGSGHGFKHGPRIGEYLMARIDGAALGEQDGADEERFRIGPREPEAAARTAGDTMAADWDLF